MFLLGLSLEYIDNKYNTIPSATADLLTRMKDVREERNGNAPWHIYITMYH